MGRYLVKEMTNKVREVLKTIQEIGALEGKSTVFIIANTTKQEDMDLYTIPVRNYAQVVTSGVVVFSEDAAKIAAKIADGLVDYIFVDAEKKIPNSGLKPEALVNIERAAKSEIHNSMFISYKANDLTVDAADSFVSEYFSRQASGVGGKHVAIIGAGNIGSKLAVKLVERGAEVFLFRRDVDKLNLTVSYINSIKSQNTAARAHASTSILNACNNTDIVIGATNGTAVIDSGLIDVAPSYSLILDIGKGSISEDAIQKFELCGIDTYRLSVESALEGMIVALIATKTTLSEKTGRRMYYGIRIVSGGLVARKGEIVVDDYNNPKHVYGIGNGYGDFNRNPNKKDLDIVKALKALINSK